VAEYNPHPVRGGAGLEDAGHRTPAA
jgi:hypothetical protein